MATFILPLENTPQSFQIALGETTYLMSVIWNDSPDAGWFMNLNDVNTGASIVTNIPFITGANLLDGLDYLGIEGQLIVYTDGDPTAVPTIDNLGVDSNVYFVTVDVTS